jgi:sugar lactone lactonase YvrE
MLSTLKIIGLASFLIVFASCGGGGGGTTCSTTYTNQNNNVTTIAGTAGTIGSADGTGAAARFNNPFGITTDGTNLYVADTDNCTIRKIEISTKAVTTITGKAAAIGFADGIGAAATFFNPAGITTDGANLYVADTNNSTIRKIY